MMFFCLSRLQSGFAIWACLPDVFDNSAASRAVTFQTLTAPRTPQIRFIHRFAAPWAILLLVIPQQEKNRYGSSCCQEKEPEEPAMVEIATMPDISPGAAHRYLP